MTDDRITEALIACHEVLQELEGADLLPAGSDLEGSAVDAIVQAEIALEAKLPKEDKE